ncbi:hypothetical protein PhCBS80983_g01783 [Powellomyces hirtus]|uniref:Uncharacterized protein n=1 Tax=Powellomyces hirtus TaxID=109895 RepID=A0A507EB37_9FUNG|nr:hypothetical protein PhCBS80983_g01783 [Powellomyces hirtus]
MDDGIDIKEFPAPLGRAAVATREFAIGDLVVSESPVLVVPTFLNPAATTPATASLISTLTDALRSALLDEPQQEQGEARPSTAAAEAEVDLQVNAIAAYMGLNQQERKTVMTNFASPPLDAQHPAIALLTTFASAAARVEGMPAFEDIQKLLLVLATNAHEFVEDGAVYVGLYDRGSKLAHSCSPKTVYVGEGRILKHYALQPIAAGDMITTNYTVRDDIRACHPTHLRQEHLLRTKFFLCECERCIVPDTLRSIPCPTCSTPNTPTTPCPTCPPTAYPISIEQRLEISLAAATAPFDDPFATGPSITAAFKHVNVVASTSGAALGPLHWITNWCTPFRALHAASNGDRTTAGNLAIAWCRWSKLNVRQHYPHIHARHLVSMGPHCVRSEHVEEYLTIAREALPWANPNFMGSDESVRRLKMLIGDKEPRPPKSQAPPQPRAPVDMSDWLPPSQPRQGASKGKGKGKK